MDQPVPHLMDDPATWFPETHTILLASRAQEVVHLLVEILGASQILGAPNLGFNQVIAMNSRWNRHLFEATGNEL